MSADSPLAIRVAQQPGDPNKPSEDRVFLTPNASIVLDGASQWMPLERSGGWIAEELGRRLQAGLIAEPARDLTELLDSAVDELITTFQLQPGKSPSTTVNIARAHGDHLDVLVLCDSPVVIYNNDGTIHQIRDDRLTAVTKRLVRPTKPFKVTDQEWQRYIKEFESQRNRAGGFWCVSATSRIARQATTSQYPLNNIRGFLALTDGVSVGVDRYQRPVSWEAAFRLANRSPRLLIQEVHSAELSDAYRVPQSKSHDDKTAVVATPSRASTRKSALAVGQDCCE